MGINYSITIGYGLALSNDELPPKLRGLDPWDDEEKFRDYLIEEGFGSIIYSHSGDLISDETYHCFFTGEVVHEEPEFLATLTELDHDESMLVPMRALAYHLEVDPRSIGWKVVLNVS